MKKTIPNSYKLALLLGPDNHRIQQFFNYAKARENIRRDKEKGIEPPWTSDPVLSKYRFCNVEREDDKVTKAVRRLTEGISPKHLLRTLTLLRWFNRIRTMEELVTYDLHLNWDHTWATNVIEDLVAEDIPIVTGAYIINTPAGMKKWEGVLWAYGQFIQFHHRSINTLLFHGLDISLQDLHTELMKAPRLGAFMAYEIVTDLYHYSPFTQMPGIMTWANPGPGATRGICRLLDWDTGHLNRNSKQDVQFMINCMHLILSHARTFKSLWPFDDRPWDMRTVEHTLCEFDKYERARMGQGRPKQVYVYGGEK